MAASQAALSGMPTALCKDCGTILLHQWHWPDQGFKDQTAHKWRFRELRQSAFAGCGLCAILFDLTVQRIEAQNRNLQVLEQDNPVARTGFADDYSTYDEYRCWIWLWDTERSQDKPVGRRNTVGRESNQHGLIDEFTYWLGNPDNHKFDFRARLSLVSGTNRYIGGRPIPTSPDLALCRDWISRCEMQHADCVRENSAVYRGLPTRVLDVGPDGSQELRLVEGKGRLGSYVCLSYRWGHDRSFMTTSENIADRQRLIKYEDLPPTFKDAVIVTRTLGHRFLWIDAICIIQNDRSDWTRECPRMASIYRGANVTIAAAASKSCLDGFLLPRDSDLTAPQIRVQAVDRQIDCVIAVRDLGSPLSHLRGIESASALASRAWTLQETLLSPRVIYFGSQQMHFECDSFAACEGFVDTDFKLLLLGSAVPKDLLRVHTRDMYQVWDQIVEEHSRRDLTYEDDRLPSLSGLAAFFQEKLHDEYCAGIWKSDIVNGLQWVNSEFEQYENRSRDLTRAPSWSWVSCGYRSSYQHQLVGPNELNAGSARALSTRSHIEIHHVHLDRINDNTFGAVSGGNIVLSGKLKAVKIGRIQRPLDVRPSIALYATNSSCWRIGWASMDYPPAEVAVPGVSLTEDSASATECYCLLISSGITQQEHFFRYPVWLGLWIGILLHRIPETENTFRRIGLARGDRYEASEDNPDVPDRIAEILKPFEDEDVETKTIKLV